MTKVTFLGTGASSGLPSPLCSCPSCSSLDIKDKRYRSSILIEKNGVSIVIDTGQEFRLQVLREGIKYIGGVLYTHSHADHSAGLDDLRPFTREKILNIYGTEKTMKRIKTRFPYIFSNEYEYNARLRTNIVEYGKEFSVCGIPFLPILSYHGNEENTIYRFGNIAYATDVSFIPKESEEMLENLDVLIIDAFRKEHHEKHFSFKEAKEFGEKIKAKKIYFTHIGHGTKHEEIKSLYSPCLVSYDGLKIEVEDE